MISRRACICLFFWDFCAGVNSEVFILKCNRMVCCCFCAWLPVCSVLNSAELLWRAHPPEIEALRICSGRGSDCRSWDRADTQCSGAAGSYHRDYSKTCQLLCRGRNVTQRTCIWWNLGVRVLGCLLGVLKIFWSKLVPDIESDCQLLFCHYVIFPTQRNTCVLLHSL